MLSSMKVGEFEISVYIVLFAFIGFVKFIGYSVYVHAMLL